MNKNIYMCMCIFCIYNVQLYTVITTQLYTVQLYTYNF